MAAQSRILALLIAVLWVFGGSVSGSRNGSGPGEHASQQHFSDAGACRRTLDTDPEPDDDDTTDASLPGSRLTLDSPSSIELGRRLDLALPDRNSTSRPLTQRPRGPPRPASTNLLG